MQQRIRRRYAAERRFRMIGLGAVLLSAAFLAFLLITMLANGVRALHADEVRLDMDFARSALFIDPATLQGFGADAALATADIDGAVRKAAVAQYGQDGADLLSEARGCASGMRSSATRRCSTRTHSFWLPASSPIDVARKSDAPAEDRARLRRADNGVRSAPASTRTSSAAPMRRTRRWSASGGAFKGSLLTMLVTLALAFPIGVLSAVYLEEYAQRNRFTDIIEVSINNLARCPRSSSACSASPCSSTSCTCRVRPRWSAD
jgi:phosphate transport system permease protein